MKPTIDPVQPVDAGRAIEARLRATAAHYARAAEVVAALRLAVSEACTEDKGQDPSSVAEDP